MKSRAKIRTQSDLANILGVSSQSIRNWSSFDDWPRKDDDGCFVVPCVLEFLRRNSLGPFKHHAINGNGRSWSEARLELTEEKIRRERAAATQQEILLAVESGKLVLIDDVEDFHAQLAGTIMRSLESLTGIEAELPKPVPSERAWQQLRERIVEFNRRAGESIAESARAFIGGYSKEDTEAGIE